MAYRIFISLIVLACAYFVFETVRFKILERSLINADAEYVLGNPEGDVTLVKFLDYSCSYCRTAHPVVTQAVKQDGRVKFLPKPVSILGEDGMNAALLVYAAGEQDLFTEMHDAVIKNFHVIDDRLIQDLALIIGADATQLITDYKSDAVREKVEDNYRLFSRYHMKSTPTYAVGSDIIFSPDTDLNVQDFLNLFNEARGQL